LPRFARNDNDFLPKSLLIYVIPLLFSLSKREKDLFPSFLRHVPYPDMGRD
jgi:hypothetical protein